MNRLVDSMSCLWFDLDAVVGQSKEDNEIGVAYSMYEGSRRTP
jgi:hypothetical protein